MRRLGLLAGLSLWRCRAPAIHDGLLGPAPLLVLSLCDQLDQGVPAQIDMWYRLQHLHPLKKLRIAWV